MSENNKITVKSYSDNYKEYIVKKDYLDDKRVRAYWPGVEEFISLLDPGSDIYEIGTGSGYDAKRLESRGFTVHRSDVAKPFIEHLRSEGFDVIEHDILDSSVEPRQDAIFANAVLLHFDFNDIRIALSNIYKSLLDDGLLCIGMKIGDFEGWREKGLSGKRYFKYWSVEGLEKELVAANFKVESSFLSEDGTYSVITARKH